MYDGNRKNAGSTVVKAAEAGWKGTTCDGIALSERTKRSSPAQSVFLKFQTNHKVMFPFTPRRRVVEALK